MSATPPSANRAEREANQLADRYEPTLHLADFREIELPEASVDAMITDPPYPREFLGLDSDLAEYAARVLRPGGVLLAMAGTSPLPEIFAYMGNNLDYVWIVSVDMVQPSSPVHHRHVLTGWKPVIFYCKDKYKDNYYDRLPSAKLDKSLHPWAQAEVTFEALIERFTKTGDTVLDPFLGAGTTGVTALAAKRKFIGIESDPATFETARRRMVDTGSSEVELPAA